MASRPSRSSRLGNVALLAVTVVVFLGLLEIVLRTFELGYGESPLLFDRKIHHKHPPSYAYRRKDAGYGEFGGFLIEYDENGLTIDPDRRIVFDPARHKRTVAVMGDSMVEAGQMPYRDGFVGLLNRRAAPDVFAVNWGVSTYSPMLYRVQWIDQVARTKPELVLMMLYSNDVEDDDRYDKTATYDAQGLPVEVAGPPDNVVVNMARHIYIARLLRVAWRTLDFLLVPQRDERTRTMGPIGGFIELSPEMSPLTDRVLQGIVREVRAAGARFVLTAIPSKYVIMSGDRSKAEQQWAANVKRWADANGVEYIDLRPPFDAYTAARKESDPKLFFHHDIHPNETGHRVIADTIAKALPEYFPQPQK
jgi:lysophospholipase L1-like esterase